MLKTPGKIHNREHLHLLERDMTAREQSHSSTTKGQRNLPHAVIVEEDLKVSYDFKSDLFRKN